MVVFVENWFTPNYEDVADVVAPKLAKCSGTAAALYHWLHSRAFPMSNSISLSAPFWAGLLNVAESSVRAALKQLAEKGLISVRTRRGNGGGTTVSLTNYREPGGLNIGDPADKPAGSRRVNRRRSGYDRYTFTDSREEKGNELFSKYNGSF